MGATEPRKFQVRQVSMQRGTRKQEALAGMPILGEGGRGQGAVGFSRAK